MPLSEPRETSSSLMMRLVNELEVGEIFFKYCFLIVFFFFFFPGSLFSIKSTMLEVESDLECGISWMCH